MNPGQGSAQPISTTTTAAELSVTGTAHTTKATLLTADIQRMVEAVPETLAGQSLHRRGERVRHTADAALALAAENYSGKSKSRGFLTSTSKPRVAASK